MPHYGCVFIHWASKRERTQFLSYLVVSKRNKEATNDSTMATDSIKYTSYIHTVIEKLQGVISKTDML